MMKQVLTEIEKQIRQSGILFDVNDMPILPKSMILREEPEELIPFEHRGVAKNPKKTAICFFSKDLLLEQRIRNLVSNLPEYGKYMGVTGFDLSIRIGMALESQLMFARINKMIDCYFAINGIKVLPNFRVGEIGSISSILNYEKGTMYAAGIIGCKNGSSILDDAILRAKLIYARPTKILTYGMPRANSTRILRDCGVCYRPYEDFRKEAIEEIFDMDSKKQYSSKVALQKFIAEKDPDLLSKIAAGVARSAKWSDSWATVDINEIVDKYAFGAKATVNGGKIEFHGERYDVIADVGGGYLRIFDKQLKAYVDADGNDVRNIEKNGKIKGRSRSEQQRLTHFAIKKGEEK